jgi:GMP synthase (glutamine-hydrolysing)
MQEMILILDFGSQYTQLIARRVRELNVYCEIHPFNHRPEITENVKGVILSGSPFSVHSEDAPDPDLEDIQRKVPLLGVCYGAQYLPIKTAEAFSPLKSESTVAQTSPSLTTTAFSSKE